MTRAERPDGSPNRQPKPAWGPGKNAALSIIAFAAIFGGFAYVQRDAGVGHATMTHDIAGMIGTAVGKYREAIATATANASDTASTIAQAEPVTPAVPGTRYASATPAVSAAAAPAAPRFSHDAMRRSLKLMIEYCAQQKLIPREFSVDELFDDVTRTLI